MTKVSRCTHVHNARAATSIDHSAFIGSKVSLEFTELQRRRRKRRRKSLNIDSLRFCLLSRPGSSISSYPIRVQKRECDRVFVSACTDILSELSQGGRAGSEAQRQQRGSFPCVSLLSKYFNSFTISTPELNSKVTPINAEKYQQMQQEMSQESTAGEGGGLYPSFIQCGR